VKKEKLKKERKKERKKARQQAQGKGDGMIGDGMIGDGSMDNYMRTRERSINVRLVKLTYGFDKSEERKGFLQSKRNQT